MLTLTLDTDTCFVLQEFRDGKPRTFHVVANQWTSNPHHATIFRSAADASRFIMDMEYHKRVGFTPAKNIPDVDIRVVPLSEVLTKGLLT